MKKKKKVKIKLKKFLLFILVLALVIYILISCLDLSGYNGEGVFPSEVFGITVHTRLVEKRTESRPRNNSQD
ncbi:MAG: hypothetical protein HFJ50_03690 [Clostridia bacterium]|jgi:hypothetical protein|nr:hypothetical protein [Clostridia bacterium]